MHRLENKPGMLLCCLLTKSLFHIKPVVHFPKALTCCGFCRLLFLISMSRKGYGCCESGRVACLRSGIKRNGPAVQECLCVGWGILPGAWGDVVRSKYIIQVWSMRACGGKGHWCGWLNAFGRLWNAEQCNVQVSVMWLNNISQLNMLLSWESPKEELGRRGYWEREWQCITFLLGRLRVAVLTFAD